MNRTAPLPWTRAAREAEAARLTEVELGALAADDRCQHVAEFLSQHDRDALRFLQWQLKRRTWRERLPDVKEQP